MNDYIKKYVKEKYKRICIDLHKSNSDEFDLKAKKLGFQKALILRTAIELFLKEDEYFIKKINEKFGKKEMTLAQLINKLKKENPTIIDSCDVVCEYFTFIDDPMLHCISIGGDGMFLYTNFKCEEENGFFSIKNKNCQILVEKNIYENRNRKIVVRKVEFI